MDIPTIEGPVAAFCGIARPAQFFAGLEAAGLQPAVRKAFPDHHPYTPADLDRLQKTARAAGAVALLTTEKDQVRLAGILSTNPDSLPLQAVRLRVEIEDQEESISQLVERLNSAPPHPPL